VSIQTAQIDGHGAGGGLQKEQTDGECRPHAEVMAMTMMTMMVHGDGHFQLAGGTCKVSKLNPSA